MKTVFFVKIFCYTYSLFQSMKSVFFCQNFLLHIQTLSINEIRIFCQNFLLHIIFASSLRPSIPRRVVSGDLHWFLFKIEGFALACYKTFPLFWLHNSLAQEKSANVPFGLNSIFCTKNPVTGYEG